MHAAGEILGELQHVSFRVIQPKGPIAIAALSNRSRSQSLCFEQLLAVTALTSFDESDLAENRYAGPMADLVEARVRTAIQHGIDGIVCSGLEAARVRAIAGPSTLIVVPGVRSAGAAVGDQKRVVTPQQALADGADYLVVGREITRAADPRAALEAFA